MIAEDAQPPETNAQFKVVLIFHLEPGQADEELRRSREEISFPNRLARQPGFVNMQLVKVSDDQTMSIQTWEAAKDWWTALEVVKRDSEGDPPAEDRPSILISRDLHAGPVAHQLRGDERPSQPSTT